MLRLRGPIEGKKTLDTNWCVESSARSAHDRGYRVTVLSDCTATDTEEEQSYAERIIFPKIGRVMTSTDFLASVG